MNNPQTEYILGITGSIRSNFKEIDLLTSQILSAKSQKDLGHRIEALPHRFSNSDIALAFAMYGCLQKGYSLKLMSIPGIFKQFDMIPVTTELQSEHFARIKDIDFLQLNDSAYRQLEKLTENAAGIILSSPVYFGDRSSVANKFMQLTNIHKLLKDKVFGMMAVGAKRNGGQETTCIYGLYDALMQEAIAVGNGPATSQYGGTVVAGEMSSALNDVYGLDRCFEAGKRIAGVAEIVKNGKIPSAKSEKLKVKVLICMDTDERYYQSLVTEYLSPYFEDHDLDIINLIDFDIDRCVACGVCPSPKAKKKDCVEKDYVCLINTERDCLDHIHEQLKDADCFILVGANSKYELTYRYQAFTERTRYLRRDDFQWTNTCVVSLLINEVGSINNPLHHLKVLTSYVRHNTIVLKPLEIICHGKKVLFESDVAPLIPTLQMISKGRKLTLPQEISYKATGYSQDILDDTIAWRK